MATDGSKRLRPRNDDEMAALESELAEKRRKLQELGDEENLEEENAAGQMSEPEEDEAIDLYDSDSEAVLAMETHKQPVMEPVSPPDSQQQDKRATHVEGGEEIVMVEEEKDRDEEQSLIADDETEAPLQVIVETKHRVKLKKETSREKHRERRADRSGRSSRRRSVENSRSPRPKKDRNSRERRRIEKHSERERQREERKSEQRVERQRSGTAGRVPPRDEHRGREDRRVKQSSQQEERQERDEGDSWRKERDLREELRRRVTEKREKVKRREQQAEEQRRKREPSYESSQSESQSGSNEEEKVSNGDEEEEKQSGESAVEEVAENSDISDEGSAEEDVMVEPATPPGRENPHSDSDVDMVGHVEPVSSDGEVEVVDDPGEEKQSSHSPEPQPDVVTYYPAISGCRSLEKEYEYLNRIEEGTYGVVYRAREKRTNDIVALKKVKMEREKEGFPITSLREINMLLKSRHPNIVHVREIVVGDNMDKIYIVMEYVEHDLKTLMESMKQPFLVGETKTLMIQLLRAVHHLHDNWILHRDLKASNLLLSHKGILKVGDFGLAREYGSPLKNYTQLVVTLWYRAPELLLGTKKYSTAVDMWSVGCLFGELVKHAPMFPGKSEIDQINKIFKELGTPNEKIWPGWSELPAVSKIKFAKQPYNNLRNSHPFLTESGLDLLNKLLTYDPTKRITAEEALKHPFFTESPLPVDPSMFPTWPAKSELPRQRKHASPTAPKGGRDLEETEGADGGNGGHGFHMGLAKAGHAAKGAGFSLRF